MSPPQGTIIPRSCRERPSLQLSLQSLIHLPLSFRISVAPECVEAFNELKLGRQLKYIIYKLSDDYKEVVIEDKGTDPDWEKFQSKLLDAKSSYKNKVGKGPRYAVYDFDYELEGGEGKRYAAFNPPR